MNLPASEHLAIAELELAKPTPDWSAYHAHKAAVLLRPKGKIGLVIGCNRGAECAKFIGFGAVEMIGVDPLAEVGADYKDPRIKYYRSFAEELPLLDQSVDFIYSYATFEHVHGLAAAWFEAARVLKPGGVIRTVAAPLWNSQHGPHWGSLLDSMPWAHLRFSTSEIIARCRASELADLRDIPESSLRYWMDPRFFNRRFAADYRRACAIPEDWEVIQNDVHVGMDSKAAIDEEVLQQLYSLGYDDRELFGGVHEFLAVKHDPDDASAREALSGAAGLTSSSGPAIHSDDSSAQTDGDAVDAQQAWQAKVEADQARFAPGRPERSGYRVFSQSDEDGIIAEIFRRVGTTNRTFVEFGAETGDQNNCHLLLVQDWNGLWIEGIEQYGPSITWNFREELAGGRLKFVNTYVSVDNINGLIGDAGIQGEIDLLSIDIDGNDWHVWKAITCIDPRVVVIEHNGYAPPNDWVMPYNPDFVWDRQTPDYGSSLAANVRLANELGYTLVATGLYSANGFFVRNDLLDGKFVGPFDAASNFRPLDYEAVVNFPRTPAAAAVFTA